MVSISQVNVRQAGKRGGSARGVGKLRWHISGWLVTWVVGRIQVELGNTSCEESGAERT